MTKSDLRTINLKSIASEIKIALRDNETLSK